MRISDWSSYVCSTDLPRRHALGIGNADEGRLAQAVAQALPGLLHRDRPSEDDIAAALAAILHPRRLEFRGRKGPQPPAGIELEDEQPPVGDRIDGVTRAARGAQRPGKRPDRDTEGDDSRQQEEVVEQLRER